MSAVAVMPPLVSATAAGLKTTSTSSKTSSSTATTTATVTAASTAVTVTASITRKTRAAAAAEKTAIAVQTTAQTQTSVALSSGGGRLTRSRAAAAAANTSINTSRNVGAQLSQPSQPSQPQPQPQNTQEVQTELQPKVTASVPGTASSRPVRSTRTNASTVAPTKLKIPSTASSPSISATSAAAAASPEKPIKRQSARTKARSARQNQSSLSDTELMSDVDVPTPPAPIHLPPPSTALAASAVLTTTRKTRRRNATPTGSDSTTEASVSDTESTASSIQSSHQQPKQTKSQTLPVRTRQSRASSVTETTGIKKLPPAASSAGPGRGAVKSTKRERGGSASLTLPPPSPTSPAPDLITSAASPRSPISARGHHQHHQHHQHHRSQSGHHSGSSTHRSGSVQTVNGQTKRKHSDSTTGSDSVDEPVVKRRISDGSLATAATATAAAVTGDGNMFSDNEDADDHVPQRHRQVQLVSASASVSTDSTSSTSSVAEDVPVVLPLDSYQPQVQPLVSTAVEERSINHDQHGTNLLALGNASSLTANLALYSSLLAASGAAVTDENQLPTAPSADLLTATSAAASMFSLSTSEALAATTFSSSWPTDFYGRLHVGSQAPGLQFGDASGDADGTDDTIFSPPYKASRRSSHGGTPTEMSLADDASVAETSTVSVYGPSDTPDRYAMMRSTQLAAFTPSSVPSLMLSSATADLTQTGNMLGSNLVAHNGSVAAAGGGVDFTLSVNTESWLASAAATAAAMAAAAQQTALTAPAACLANMNTMLMLRADSPENRLFSEQLALFTTDAAISDLNMLLHSAPFVERCRFWMDEMPSLDELRSDSVRTTIKGFQTLVRHSPHVLALDGVTNPPPVHPCYDQAHHSAAERLRANFGPLAALYSKNAAAAAAAMAGQRNGSNSDAGQDENDDAMDYASDVDDGWAMDADADAPSQPPRLPVPMRTRNTPKITLALDLDETLVHCSVEELPDADHVFTVPFGPDVYTIWCRIRPHMAEFLERVSSKFELVLFTASHPNYAVKALEIIDPRNRIFRHRLYRTSCVYYQNNYIKDLTVLDRKLAHVALVDNSPHAYSFHPVNGVPIRTWYDDPFDEELLKVADFLDTIADVEDVRPHIDKFFKTRTRMFESSRFPAF